MILSSELNCVTSKPYVHGSHVPKGNIADIADIALKVKTTMPTRVALAELDACLAKRTDVSLVILADDPPAFILKGAYDPHLYALFLRSADAIYERIAGGMKYKQ